MEFFKIYSHTFNEQKYRNGNPLKFFCNFAGIEEK